MSRIPLPYNPKVMDLFRNPKNLGKMEDATVVAIAGNPACGDMITFYLKIENNTITKASFESYGCAANIATSNIVTEMIKGLSLETAWTDITWKRVTEEIGGLPSVKFHCGVLAVGALKRAIRQYFTEKGGEAPVWLPKDLTFEEKQALEEEELAKTLSKRLKPEEEKK
ncbi:MAG: iron-sulfur cluster assembly scaffold protein [Candidatus Bathyarchaeota archaeon]|nr:iron-sulfur cluster assembly scaffold protein [Candidatus Bathyarchaeota archaeon]